MIQSQHKDVLAKLNHWSLVQQCQAVAPKGLLKHSDGHVAKDQALRQGLGKLHAARLCLHF